MSTTLDDQVESSKMVYNSTKPPPAQGNNSQKLVRTTSLESIKKFNTFICSQNFYILPALLAWLRAPHHKLHHSVERFIAILKFLLFTTYLPRQAFKLLIASVHHAKQQLSSFCQTPAFIMRLTVYLALASVFLQLCVCLYALAGVFLPAGFLFMCTCLYLITQMNYSCLQFYVQEKEVFDVVTGKFQKVQKRLSRRNILGKRTISNMNLI